VTSSDGRLLRSVPGLLSAAAIVYAIRRTAAPKERHHLPVRVRVRPVLAGPLGRLMIGVTAFEIGNCATTLLILRATDLFAAGHGREAATQLAVLLYMGYNVAAALVSVPAGWHGDRRGPVRVLAGGRCCSRPGTPGSRPARPGRWRCCPRSCWPGWGSAAPRPPRAVQADGNLIASAVAGLLWSAVSPLAAFVFLAAAMVFAAVLIATAGRGSVPAAR